MYSLVTGSFYDFKRALSKYLTFELIYSVVASFLFAPFLSYMFNRFLLLMGDSSLLNSEVYTLGISFSGIAVMFFVSFFAVAFLFVEFGVLIFIAHKNYFDRDIYLSNAFISALQKLPKIAGVGLIPLMVLLLLFIPFMDASTLPPLFDVNITIFLTDLLYQSTVAKISYAAVFFGVLYLFTRWMFVLHYIFLENQTVGWALKSSWVTTRHHKLHLVLTIALLNVVIIAAGFLMIQLTAQIGMLLETHILGEVINRYLLIFSSFLTMLFSLFFIPINTIILTRLFYQIQLSKGEKVRDHVTLAAAKPLVRVESLLRGFLINRKIMTATFGFLLVAGMYFINDTLNEKLVYLKWDVAVASHRGDPQHAPENSMSSIRSAIAKGVDAVEVDVAMTKDNVLVLSHDLDLRRTAGVSMKIKNFTYEELSKIDIGRLYDKKFTGEQIPRLSSVLEEVKTTDTKLIVDLKAADADRNFAEKVVDVIEENEAEDLAYVQAFDYDLLQEIHAKNSQIKIGQVLFLSAGNLDDVNVDFYTIRQSMLTKRFVKRADSLDREVWVWTVNIKRNMKEVLTYNIDGIITDYPLKAQRMIEIR